MGEAGIGKSRLAEALRERLGEACVPFRFQRSPYYINRALHPVVQYIEIGGSKSIRGSGETKFEKLSAWLGPLADEVAAELPILAALLSISATGLRRCPR